VTGARAARAAGWPAIAVGCLDEAGVVPDSGQDSDTVDQIDTVALNGALQLALGIVAGLDAALAARRIG
jgi:hypothetical protein